MPLEGIPMSVIMMTVTGLLAASAFVVFGVTCYNMKKKRSSRVSKIGVEGLAEDITGVVVVPVVHQLSEDVRDTTKGKQAVNNEVDDASGANEDDSDATMDAGAVDATIVPTDTTTGSVDATALSVDAAVTAVDSSVVIVNANAS